MKSKSCIPFLIVIGIVLIILPFFFTKNYYRMLFDQALINVIIVLGLNLVTGLTGQMNLGMAGMFAAGAYTSALLTTKLDVSPWLGLVAAVVVAVIIGVSLGWPSLRIKGIYLALTTIGFGEIVRLVLTNLADLTGGTQGVLNIPPYNLFGYKIDHELSFYYFLLPVTAISIWVSLRIVNSKWGRAFKAIRDSDQAAEACGVNVAQIKIIAFVLSAVFGGIGGALYAHLMGYINPADFNIDLSVKYLMMLMLGGIGSVPGSIIGGIVITILPEWLRFLKDYYWLIFSILILVTVVALPHGLISLSEIPAKFAKTSKSGRK